MIVSREAQLFVGWVSGRVTRGGFRSSTQPTFMFNSTHPVRGRFRFRFKISPYIRLLFPLHLIVPSLFYLLGI
ncbi:hypothetical protein FIV49_12990 [Cylindrospermopsis raciborskii GIHE 2018]|nr:hypothetical protein FIV49_12990 [Cylindrospermopsis raciborskii GIHE 2018]